MTEILVVKEILPPREAEVTNSVTRQLEKKSVQPLILTNGRDDIFVEAWGDLAGKCQTLCKDEAIVCHLATSTRSYARQDGSQGYSNNVTLVSFCKLFPQSW